MTNHMLEVKWTKFSETADARQSNPTRLSLMKTDVVGGSSHHSKAGQAPEMDTTLL
jgi:hypothetical protein